MVFAEGQKNWQMKYDSLEEDPCMYGNLIVDRGDIGRWLGKGLLRKWFWDHWWSMWEKSRIVFLLHILMQKSFCMDLKVDLKIYLEKKIKKNKDLPGKDKKFKPFRRNYKKKIFDFRVRKIFSKTEKHSVHKDNIIKLGVCFLQMIRWYKEIRSGGKSNLKSTQLRAFSGSPVIKTPSFHCRGSWVWSLVLSLGN